MLFPPLAFWDEGRAREKDNGPYVPGAWGGIVILPVPGVGKGRGGGPQPAGRGPWSGRRPALARGAGRCGAGIRTGVRPPALRRGDPGPVMGDGVWSPRSRPRRPRISGRGSGPRLSAAETPDL